jgi:hypothetical protein
VSQVGTGHINCKPKQHLADKITVAELRINIEKEKQLICMLDLRVTWVDL